MKYKYYIINKNLSKDDEKSNDIYEEIKNMKEIIKNQDKTSPDIEGKIKGFFEEKFKSEELKPFDKVDYNSEENIKNISYFNKKKRKRKISNKMKIENKIDFCYKKILEDFASQTMTLDEYRAAYPFIKYKIFFKK